MNDTMKIVVDLAKSYAVKKSENPKDLVGNFLEAFTEIMSRESEITYKLSHPND